MINTHEQEKKQFIRLFQEQGLDRFDERFQVLEAFLQLDHHVTQAEIVRQLEKNGKHLSDSFVESSMEHLCRFGFATKVEFDREETRYEHRHLGIHHDHMICTKCGTILEFKDEALEKQQHKIALAYGFHMLQHRMEIYGLCSACMAKRPKMVLLNKAKQGERLKVRQLEAGRQMQLRISSMGLKIGDDIEVVSNGFGGQVVIASGDTRLVIGSGMAQKIWGEPIGTAPDFVSDTKANTASDAETVRVLLCDMRAGQQGTIVRVSGESTLRRRLLEMGINRGTHVYVEKYAPLKDPIELVVKGYHISLRVEEAAQILVENVTTRKKGT
jgi:Fur family transcriptional regulator, ferric uptake regulator